MNVRVEERFLNDVMRYYHNNSPVFSRCSRCRYSFSFFFFFFFLILQLPFGPQLQALIEGTCS